MGEAFPAFAMPTDCAPHFSVVDAWSEGHPLLYGAYPMQFFGGPTCALTCPLEVFTEREFDRIDVAAAAATAVSFGLTLWTFLTFVSFKENRGKKPRVVLLCSAQGMLLTFSWFVSSFVLLVDSWDLYRNTVVHEASSAARKFRASKRLVAVICALSAVPVAVLGAEGEFGHRPGGSYCWIADVTRTTKLFNRSWVQVLYIPLLPVVAAATCLYLRTIYQIVRHDRELRKTFAGDASPRSPRHEAHASACDRLCQRFVARDLRDYWIFKYYRPLLHVTWMTFMTLYLTAIFVKSDGAMDAYEQSFAEWAECLVVQTFVAPGREEDLCGEHPAKRLAPGYVGAIHVLIYSWGGVLFLIYGWKAEHYAQWELALRSDLPKTLSRRISRVRASFSRRKRHPAVELAVQPSIASVYGRQDEKAGDGGDDKPPARPARDVV
ncbi:hypothetical protein SO694_00122080 [Aureococcus anophagefferens]|uniref:G-protein coupled receptors family 2 profile 2 domain-containing protein n=1 Tax=Aureococcus anophagefferens TaxID=44056 RepID=A0ABR1G338_AURAN